MVVREAGNNDYIDCKSLRWNGCVENRVLMAIAMAIVLILKLDIIEF